jgi:hypothetical protein
MTNSVSDFRIPSGNAPGRLPSQHNAVAPKLATVAPKDTTTPAEFAQTMLNKYDGGNQSINYANDTKVTQAQESTTNLLTTGYPRGFANARIRLEGLAAATAQMDEETREGFAARAKAVIGEPDAQRDAAIQQLKADVISQLEQTRADPLKRMNAVFNMPTGAGLLGDAGTQRLQQLRDQYSAFSAPAATAQQREASFAQAVKIKTDMQRDILNKAGDVYAATQKSWNDSAARVNDILDAAQQYKPDKIKLPKTSDDPDWDDDTRKPAYAKTFPYQSVMEKLLSDDGYSSQERATSSARQRPPEQIAQDLLTFQQGMTDRTSSIHRRMQALQDQALTTMDKPGEGLSHVEKPQTFEDVANNPPAPDKDYVDNLAKNYGGALKDIDGKNREMLREDVPGLADKILYGVGRVFADLSPIPGADWLATRLLDAEFPDHGGLSRGQVGLIDAGTAIGGLLLGGLGPEGEHLPGVGEHPSSTGGALHPEPSASLPAGSVDVFERNFAGSGSETKDPSPTGSAHQHAPDTPVLPSRYAAQPSGTLQPDPAHAGVLIDSKGQRYIQDHGQSYPVRYDTANQTWRVVQPDKPAEPGVPIERRPDGSWKPHDAVGLRGGGNESRDRHTAVGDEQKAYQIQQAHQTLAHLQTQLQTVTQDVLSTARRLEEIRGLQTTTEQRKADLLQRKNQTEQESANLIAQLQQLESTGQPHDPQVDMRIRELRDRRQTIRAELTRFNDDMAKLRGELNTLLPQIHQLNDRRHQYQQMERQLQTQIGVAQFELSQLLH